MMKCFHRYHLNQLSEFFNRVIVLSEYQMNRFLKIFAMTYGVSAIMNIPLGPFKTALQSEKSMEYSYSLPKEPNTIFSYVLQNMEKMSIELMDCMEKLLKMRHSQSQNDDIELHNIWDSDE